MEAGLAPLDPLELRQVLVDTGTPQTGPAENIGPLPDLPGALAAIVGEVAVAVDIQPRKCPNRVRTDGRGNLPVAILGTPSFEVREIDIGSVRLAGVPPKVSRSAFRDVATPFEPFVGRDDAHDCTRKGADGLEDLLLRFSNRRVVRALGPVSNREVVVPLTGELADGTPIRGEDVILIVKPRGRAGPSLEAGLSPDLEASAAVISDLEDEE
jgi:hypothetical protein